MKKPKIFQIYLPCTNEVFFTEGSPKPSTILHLARNSGLDSYADFDDGIISYEELLKDFEVQKLQLAPNQLFRPERNEIY